MTMAQPGPNPRRVAAGKRNRRKRRGLTVAGRERLRQAALANRPWEQSSGPKTVAGKAQAALNGKRRQKGDQSQRELRALVADITALGKTMLAGRKVGLTARSSDS